MILKQSFHQFYNRLVSIYREREARHIADLIFEKITGYSRLDRITKPDIKLTPEQQETLDKKLSRLLQHIPVQYVLGEAWFYQLPFRVNEHVLIPRPETEELVSWILDELKENALLKKSVPSTILDIGTGSGCIAIALKKNFPAVQVMGMDKSAEALKTAKENAALNQVNVDFFQEDLLTFDFEKELPAFDLIVSNPPYIPLKEKAEMQPQVAEHEPSAALFVPDDDPLIFYRAILNMAQKKLIPGGKVFMEIHENFGAEMRELFQHYPFKDIILKKDMTGRDRMICGVL